MGSTFGQNATCGGAAHPSVSPFSIEIAILFVIGRNFSHVLFAKGDLTDVVKVCRHSLDLIGISSKV